MDRPVTVACVQAEPVILDRGRTLDRLEELAAEAARNGAELVVFPETFVPVYPSSRWAKAFAGWQDDGAKATFARIAQNSISVGSPDERRLGAKPMSDASSSSALASAAGIRITASATRSASCSYTSPGTPISSWV